MLAARSVRLRGLFLGTALDDGSPLHLAPARLATGLHVLGRTGSGKTRVLLNIFKQLAYWPQATVIVLSPKGDFVPMCNDFAVANGMTRRLVVFDPGDTETVCGYNPLSANGIAPHLQAKSVREALRAAFGQSSFDITPQLARLSFLILYAARLLEVTLADALSLLRPHAPDRRAMLERLPDPFLRDALEHFVGLAERRQDELAASTLARLEAFVLDPIIRRILTSPRSLNIADVVREGRILLVNLERNRPLRSDDLHLLGRFIVNDVLGLVFARDPGERSPVFLIIDEVEEFCTADLCVALNEGRELGLVPIIAHQNLEQLVMEDQNRQLLASVLNNATTRIVMGGTHPNDLRQLQEELFLEDYDPKRIKDEITTLELEPVETSRRVTSRTVNWDTGESEGESSSHGRTKSHGTTHTEGESEQEGETFTETDNRGVSHSISKQLAHPDLRTNSHAVTFVSGEGDADVDMSGSSDADLYVTEDGMMISSFFRSATTLSSHRTRGRTSSSYSAQGDVEGEARTQGTVRSEGETDSWQQGAGSAHANTSTHGSHSEHSVTGSEAETETTGRSRERSRRRGGAVSVQDVPWNTYRKTRRVSSRTFYTLEEQLTLRVQEVMRLRKGQFIIKVPSAPAVSVQAPFVETPRLGSRLRERALERMRALPCYASPAEIEAHERERVERLRPMNRVRRSPRRPRSQPPRDF